MRKNSYATKLMIQKAVLTQQQRKVIIDKTFETTYKMAVVALNRAFGIGATRIKLFNEIMDELFTEYEKLMDEVDVDYADGKLDEQYNAVIGGK